LFCKYLIEKKREEEEANGDIHAHVRLGDCNDARASTAGFFGNHQRFSLSLSCCLLVGVDARIHGQTNERKEKTEHYLPERGEREKEEIDRSIGG
jgi:hypothetical protein